MVAFFTVAQCMKEFSYLQGNGLSTIIYGLFFYVSNQLYDVDVSSIIHYELCKSNNMLRCAKNSRGCSQIQRVELSDIFLKKFLFGNELRCSFSESMQSNGVFFFFFLSSPPFFLIKANDFSENIIKVYVSFSDATEREMRKTCCHEIIIACNSITN